MEFVIIIFYVFERMDQKLTLNMKLVKKLLKTNINYEI